MEYISSWRSPSNIALIKYWGKHGIQLPRNPSLSFTLSACHTVMTMVVNNEANTPKLTVLFDGMEMPSFIPKIKLFFNLIKRSEEHTSELQSPCNLVCRLLL